jgi:hypothetical protein
MGKTFACNDRKTLTLGRKHEILDIILTFILWNWSRPVRDFLRAKEDQTTGVA